MFVLWFEGFLILFFYEEVLEELLDFGEYILDLGLCCGGR